MSKAYKKWAEQNYNTIICACGCGQYVLPARYLYYILKNNPKHICYLNNHHPNTRNAIRHRKFDQKTLDTLEKYKNTKCFCGCGAQIKITILHARRHNEGVINLNEWYVLGHKNKGKPGWRKGITPKREKYLCIKCGKFLNYAKRKSNLCMECCVKIEIKKTYKGCTKAEIAQCHRFLKFECGLTMHQVPLNVKLTYIQYLRARKIVGEKRSQMPRFESGSLKPLYL